MILWKSCDYCGEGHQAIHHEGGGYCSSACAQAAERMRRRAGRELGERQRVARERQADTQGALTIGLALVALILVLCSGCDAPGDHVGPDERNHVAAGHRIGGIE